MNVLSRVLPLPNGAAHFALTLRDGKDEHPGVRVRLAVYHGVYAAMLQYYVARWLYWDRVLVHFLGRCALADRV